MRSIMFHGLAASVAFAAAGTAGAKPNTPSNSTADTAATTTAAKPKREKPVFELLPVRADIPLPAIVRGRGGSDTFPWETLPIGASFGLKGRDAKSLESTVNSANKRSREKPFSIFDPATGTAKMMMKHFVAQDVNPATDPDGATVRVFRFPDRPHEVGKTKKAKSAEQPVPQSAAAMPAGMPMPQNTAAAPSMAIPNA